MSLVAETAKLTLAIKAYGDLVKSQVTGINTVIGAAKGGKDQLVFFSNDQQGLAMKGDELVKKINFISSDQELTDAKGATVNFGTVFNTWKRFSHNSTLNQPAIESELSAWTYDSVNNQIKNTTNSSSFIGLVSPEKVGDYVFEVDISSDNGDNDIVGIVLAYTEVDGRGYTLSALRSPGGMGYKLLTIAYNWAGGTGNGAKDIGSTNGGLKWGDGVVDNSRVVDNAAAYATSWLSQGTGCRLKATRVGDVITVVSSNMNDNANYVATSQVVIDLSSDPVLAKFKGSASFGYCGYSQPNGTWKPLQAPAPKYPIYDLRNNHIWRSIGGVWVDQGYATAALFDKGRMYKNLVNGSVYYADPNGTLVTIGAPGLGA